jgi:histone H3
MESIIKKKRICKYFESYISKVLKKITIDYGITLNAKQQLNNLLLILCKKLSENIRKLTIISGKKTISILELETIFKIFFPKKFINNLVDNFEKTEKIVFPTSTPEKILRDDGFTKLMVTKKSPKFMAFLLENICFLILEKGIEKAIEFNHNRITIRDIYIGIQDTFIKKIMNKFSIFFTGGCVIPGIHESLINKKRRPVKQDQIKLEKKTHRFRAGTVCLRDIKKYQKTSNCLVFSKVPFEMFVRRLVNDKNKKISGKIFILLQYYIEQYFISLLKDINKVSIYKNRVKIIPEDIEFMCSLKGIKFNLTETNLTETNLTETNLTEDHATLEEKPVRVARVPIDEPINEPIEKTTEKTKKNDKEELII